MNKGDILILYTDNIQTGMPVIVYDKSIGITFDMWNISILDIEDVIYKNNYSCKIIQPIKDTSWLKKKKLNDHLVGIITGSIKPNYRQRLHFLNYIIWLYEELLDIKLLEYPMPITVGNLIESDKVRGKDV